MVWINSHPKDKNFELAPVPQYVTVQYRGKHHQLPDRNKYEENSALEELGNIWRESQGWRISGGMAASGIAKDYGHQHENLDIAVLRQKEPFRYMIEEAKKKGLFLFTRPQSYKWSLSSDYKHEKFVPIMNLDSLLEDYGFDLNPFLCRVDNNGNIYPENSVHSRLKFFFYHVEKDKLVCAEDKSRTNPESFFKGPTIHLTRNHHEVKSVHPLMLKELYDSIIAKNGKEKHIKKREILKRFLD